MLKNRSGLGSTLFRLCCRIAAVLFRPLGILRRGMYRAGLLRTHAAPARVISVGNITVGGTGKTPLVTLLADRLAAKDLRPVILTRGYGRRSPDMVFLPDETAGWEQAGDEPLMMSSALPAVPIVVSSNRVAAAHAAWDRYHPRVFLLDDGMQHLRLRRDLEIVVVDATLPLEGERIFPAGRLRENLGGLRRADVFFLTRTRQSGQTESISAFLSRYHPGAVQIRSEFRPVALRELPDGQQLSLEWLRDRPVAAFSGIGNPAALECSLADLGVRLSDRLHFPDHHPYTRQDVDRIEERARERNAQAILTTEKDAVRLEHIDRRTIPFLALMVRIEITAGAEKFWRIITEGS